MRTVYVLMYWSDEDGMMDVSTGETSPPRLKPYAVFEDAITAEKMKRDGDEIVKVPYFRNDCPDHLTITEEEFKGWPNAISSIPCETHITYQYPKYHPDSTHVVPEPQYPKVTCQKTVDEHTWRDRSD